MTRARHLAALAVAGWIGASSPSLATPTQDQPDDGWVVSGVSLTPRNDGLTIAATISPPISEGPAAQTVTDVLVSVTRVGEPALSGCAVANHRELLADDDDLPPPDTTTPDTTTPDPSTPDTSTPTTEVQDDSGAATFFFTVPIRCNGRYEVALVEANADGPGPASDPAPAGTRDLGEAAVNTAPPDVRSVLSNFNPSTRVVGVAWQPPTGYGEATGCTATPASDHPDFAGYVVQRAVGESGSFATLPNGTVAMGSQCLVDRLPAEAPLGQYRYRVLAARTGAAGLVLAAGGVSAVTTVSVGAPPATAPPTTARPRPPIAASGGAGGPVVGPAGPAPLDDGTFEETLDYPEEGEEAAVLPEDADTFLDFVPSPGPGILVPFAIAECLAVWAFHLRYLARRADDGY